MVVIENEPHRELIAAAPCVFAETASAHPVEVGPDLSFVFELEARNPTDELGQNVVGLAFGIAGPALCEKVDQTLSARHDDFGRAERVTGLGQTN